MNWNNNDKIKRKRNQMKILQQEMLYVEQEIIDGLPSFGYLSLIQCGLEFHSDPIEFVGVEQVRDLAGIQNAGDVFEETLLNIGIVDC